jgi:choline kinase
MKAIILAAGIGSRIKPLTDNCPKCLLKIGNHTILEMMVSHILECGIKEIIFVVGYLESQIKDYIQNSFPGLKVQFVTNQRYMETNTGYSLMLASELINGSDFVKFDADVVFDNKILKNLIESDFTNCLCIDRNINLEAEEIKVIIQGKNRVVKASKTVDPLDAVGESIGIEKIDSKTAKTLFSELELMMNENKYLQAYYESAYERLIDQNIPFHAIDISGLGWTEIDTKDDYLHAKSCVNF